MAIIVSKQNRGQQYLILGLVGVLLAALLVIWYGFFLRKPPSLVNEALPPEKVKIRFDVLSSEEVLNLQAFEPISIAGGEIGRENPFIPYQE